jgi:FkbM family methyltransferase
MADSWLKSFLAFQKSYKSKVETGVLWYNNIALKDSDTVVEIGALTGNISLHAWRAFGITNIYAVEALPDNFQILMNNCKGSPVKTVNVAIGENDCQVSFFEYGLCSSSSLFRIDSSVKYQREMDLKLETLVRCVTLATFMKEHRIGGIDFLILNCEGAERFILPEIIESEGMVAAIRQISIELHPMILGQREVLRLIRLACPRYDYRVITRTIRGPINVIFTRRETPFTGGLDFYLLQYGYASIMDFLWPYFRFLMKLKRLIRPSRKR